MKVKIEVGEPRGFNAGDGTNVITGTIIDGLSGSRVVDKNPSMAAIIQAPGGEQKEAEKTTEYWFVANCNPVKSGEISFSSLLFTPRYKVKKPPIESLDAGEDLTLNAIWRTDGEPWDRESIAAAQEGNIDVEGIMVAKVKKISD